MVKLTATSTQLSFKLYTVDQPGLVCMEKDGRASMFFASIKLVQLEVPATGLGTSRVEYPLPCSAVSVDPQSSA